MPWQPTGTVIENWGRLQLVIGGQDVSFYRNVPAQVGSWTSNEPFDDATLEINFPQITPFEALPAWLADYSNVELYLIRPDDSRKALFEGMFVDEGDNLDENGSGLTIQFIGALYQGDFFRARPPIAKQETVDIGPLISDLLRSTNPDMASLRTMPIERRWTGITFTKHGAWNPLLTGHIQDMLAVATASGQPAPGESIVGGTQMPDGTGYLLTGTLGSVLAYGKATYEGGMLGTPLKGPSSRITYRVGRTDQYWMVAADGGVFSFGRSVPFYGSAADLPLNGPIVGIESSLSGDGYVLVGADGGVFAFGDYPFAGAVTPAVGTTIVDIARAYDSNGYWAMTNKGHIYAMGTATYQGGAEGTGKTFMGFAAHPSLSGYWLVSTDGYVYAYGTGVTHHGDNGAAVENEEFVDIMPTPTGAGYWLVARDGGVFAYGDAVFYGSVPSRGGKYTQWTLTKEPGRVPVVAPKDVTTVHWTVTVGTPGVTHSLTRDLTQAYNAVYGAGTAPSQGVWRNTKYPTVFPDATPVFGGTELKVGSTHADVLIWERHMFDSGHVTINRDGKFDQVDSNVARSFQQGAGLTLTGTVNAQTWAASFNTGANAGDPDIAHFAPLTADRKVVSHLYNPKGAIIGDNPAYDPKHVRREEYYNFGDMVTKNEGHASASQLMARDDPASYVGQVVLKIDPEEGSRFEMRSGQNLLLKSHRGVNRLLHIASANVAWDGLTVTLTVDERARDAVTLAAIRQRRRETLDPTRSQTRTYRNSQQVEDRRSVWDAESGAGIIPRHAIAAGMWNVLMIPAGTLGTVVRSEFTVDTPARFSVGVFDRPVTPNMMQAANVTGNPLDEGYWDVFDEVEAAPKGLIVAWGGKNQALGFHPGEETNTDDLLTGRGVDDASWYFESEVPPYLWVALWCESPANNFIQGRLFAGVNT